MYDIRFLSNGLLYAPMVCNMQAMYNAKNRYAQLGLKIVVGSLGLGKGRNVFFEFGGAHYKTVKQYFPPNMSGADIHTWLEDNDGNVYDIVTAYMVDVTKIRSLKMDFKAEHIIEGLSKSKLRQHGLTYVPANPDIHDHLRQRFLNMVPRNMVPRLCVIHSSPGAVRHPPAQPLMTIMPRCRLLLQGFARAIVFLLVFIAQCLLSILI